MAGIAYMLRIPSASSLRTRSASAWSLRPSLLHQAVLAILDDLAFTIDITSEAGEIFHAAFNGLRHCDVQLLRQLADLLGRMPDNKGEQRRPDRPPASAQITHSLAEPRAITDNDLDDVWICVAEPGTDFREDCHRALSRLAFLGPLLIAALKPRADELSADRGCRANPSRHGRHPIRSHRARLIHAGAAWPGGRNE
jgi:hypothetical protein